MAEPIAASRSLRAYAETLPPEPSTPWREADFCVVDIETTGLDPAEDEVVSFAAVHIAGGRLRLADSIYQLIRPRRMPGRQSIVIHGLRSVELANAPTFAEALDGLLEALTGRAMVAHVASIEAGFLGAAFRDSGIKLVNPIIDTAALAAELFRVDSKRPRPRPLALTTLAESLGLPVHRPHEADGDALTTAQAFLALAAHLDQFSPQTVGSMQRLSHRTSTPAHLTAAARRFLRRHRPRRR